MPLARCGAASGSKRPRGKLPVQIWPVAGWTGQEIVRRALIWKSGQRKRPGEIRTDLPDLPQHTCQYIRGQGGDKFLC